MKLFNKKTLSIIGFSYVLIGIIIIFGSFQGITGQVIAEEILLEEYGRILGFVFLLVGLFILLSRKWVDEEPRYKGFKREGNHFHDRDSLRGHNKEGRHYARKAFHEEYGRYPDKSELRDYMKTLHEKGEIHGVIERRKTRKRVLGK